MVRTYSLFAFQGVGGVDQVTQFKNQIHGRLTQLLRRGCHFAERFAIVTRAIRRAIRVVQVGEQADPQGGCIVRQKGLRLSRCQSQASTEQQGAAFEKRSSPDTSHGRTGPVGRLGLFRAASQFAFAAGCVLPPRLSRFAVHELHDRHERVEHARIVPLTIDFTQSFVELMRIPAAQILGHINSDASQITGDRRSDIAQLLQVGQFTAIAMSDGVASWRLQILSNDSELCPVAVPSASSLAAIGVSLSVASFAPTCPHRWALVKRIVLPGGAGAPTAQRPNLLEFDEVQRGSSQNFQIDGGVGRI